MLRLSKQSLANVFSPRTLRQFPHLLFITSYLSLSLPPIAQAQNTPTPDQTIACDILIAGGGLAGAGAAYEALLGSKTVCMTEITDWVGGQISSQGTSALDERPTQRAQLFYPKGYLELRDRIEKRYGELNPGDCWVSVSCFLPKDAHQILYDQLRDAEKRGKGKLNWFPSTVIKDLTTNSNGKLITSAIAIQHQPQPGKPPLNTYPLSQTIADAYSYQDSQLLAKTAIRFQPKNNNWLVIDATETGEIIGLADVPYLLGVDPRTYRDPSSSSIPGDAYCTQGFTYTFAMEATEEAQDNPMPSFYPQYEPYYSYELERLASFDLVFTYRRIWSPKTGSPEKFRGISFTVPTPGDISMQNWTWGNDYRPGTSQDNLIYTRSQLRDSGQLNPGGWQGGLRFDTLRRGEENSWGYFYWLVQGDTDSRLGDGVKKPYPNHLLLKGLDSPMGTVHGLSKYPYMREGRRILGRPSYGYDDGFLITETDMSRKDFRGDYYRQNLSPQDYRNLWTELARTDAIKVIRDLVSPQEVEQSTRAVIYPDSVGIGHYAIDFHPCMNKSLPEAPGNTEREGERQGAGQAYPFQIPLRAMIPQKIDNMLVAGKSIATSHIAAAAYRVHSFEWSSGAAAGVTADFALEKGILPYQLVDGIRLNNPQLQELRQRLANGGNPTAFPGTSILNESWDDWR